MRKKTMFSRDFTLVAIGQIIYGVVFEKIGSGAYIPFYAAAAVMIAIAVFTRRVFYGIDGLIGGRER